MLNVFVTGATGFVGQNIVETLVSAGHAVTCLVLPKEEHTLPPQAAIVRGDITKLETLESVMVNHDAAIHLAGAVAYGTTWDQCRRLNVDGTKNVATAAIAAGIDHFIHMSSVAVYGRVADTPLTEETPLRKIGDPYGDTKIEAELLLRNLCAGSEMALTVLRPVGMYGPGDKQFIPPVIDYLTSGSLFGLGKGYQSVDGAYVNDVAAFVRRILETPSLGSTTYNLANPGNPTWRELANLVSEEVGTRAPRIWLPFPLAMVLAWVAEWVARLTRSTPRLMRYGVRVVAVQTCMVTKRAQAAGFKTTLSLVDSVRAQLLELSSPEALLE